MGAIASLITSLTIVYSTVYSDADHRKHQSSASLAFVGGIHQGPVNSPHKWPVTRKMFPFDDVIMNSACSVTLFHSVSAPIKFIFFHEQGFPLQLSLGHWPFHKEHMSSYLTNCENSFWSNFNSNDLIGSQLGKSWPDSITSTVLKIMTICHARDQWKFARSCKQMRSLHPWNLPGTALVSEWISALPGSLKFHWVRQYLVIVVLFWIKDL